jgi:hypothetical protein
MARGTTGVPRRIMNQPLKSNVYDIKTKKRLLIDGESLEDKARRIDAAANVFFEARKVLQSENNDRFFVKGYLFVVMDKEKLTVISKPGDKSTFIGHVEELLYEIIDEEDIE